MSRWIVVFSLALFSCANLTQLQPGVCGNGVVEPGEDCEQGQPNCGSTGDKACRLLCQTTPDCPGGWGCGDDGVCRHGQRSYLAQEPVSDPADQRVVGDFDGDGKPDLLSIQNGSVRIRFGDGAGSFGPPLERSARFPVTVGQADARDVDGDGITDLLLPTPAGLEVLRGSSSRQLVPESFVSQRAGDATQVRADFPVRAAPGEEAILSVIALAPSDPLRALVTRIGQNANGDGGISDLPGLQTSSLPPRGATADTDSDGGEELALVVAPSSVELLHLVPDLFTSSWVAAVATVSVSGPVTGRGRDLFGDVDDDGKIDLVLEGSDGRAQVALGDGKGNLSPAGPWPALNALGSFPLALHDLDGDGHTDVVTREGVYLSRTGTLVAAYTPPGAARFGEATIADFDGDGMQDVAVSYSGQPGVDLLLSTCVSPSCETLLFRRIHVATTGPARILRSADFDGRGRPDLVFVVASGPEDVLELVRGENLEEPVVAEDAARLPQLLDMEVGLGGSDSSGTRDGFPDLFVTGVERGQRFVSTIFGGGFLSAPYSLEYDGVAENPLAATSLPGGLLAVLTSESPGASRLYVIDPGAVVSTERHAYTLSDDALSRFGNGCALLRAGAGVVALITKEGSGCTPDLAVAHVQPGPDLSPLQVSVLAGRAPARDAVLLDDGGGGSPKLVVASRDGVMQVDGGNLVPMDAHALAFTRADADPGPELAVAADGRVVILGLAGGQLVDRSPATPVPAGTWIASADVNGDGVPDLITGDDASFRLLLAVPSAPHAAGSAARRPGAEGGAGGEGGSGGQGGAGGGDCTPADSPLDPQLAGVATGIRQLLAGDAGEPGVALVVVRNGQVEVEGAFGFAGPCRPMTTSTRTLVREGAELITTAALFDEEKDGLLGDGDTISHWIPEFQLQGGVAPPMDMTLARLMQHATGLPSGASDLHCAGFDALALDALARTWQPRVWGAPGQFYIESTRGMALTALALERAGGAPFADVIQRRVFDPAGMKATYDPLRAVAEGVAVPYETRYPIEGCAAYQPTAVFASAEDMGKLLAWLFENPRMSDGVPRLENSGGPGFLTGTPQGYGQLLWYLHQNTQVRTKVAWLAGAAEGFATGLAYAPKEHLGVVVVTNGTSGDFPNIVFGVLEALLGTNVPQQGTTGRRADYVGTYTDSIGVGWGPRVYTVSIEVDGNLWIRTQGLESQLTPVFYDGFSTKLEDIDLELRFWRDKSDRVYAFTALDNLGPPAYRAP